MNNPKLPKGKPKGNRKENSDDDGREQICIICAQNVPGPEREKIFAFGKCDHQVCYVCSSRLRVVCEQSDCPICRENIESVVFVGDRSQTYEKCNLKDWIYDEKYKIYFESKKILNAFNKLLKYECQVCLDSSKRAPANKLPANSVQKSSPDQESSASRKNQQKSKEHSMDDGLEKKNRDKSAVQSGGSNLNSHRKMGSNGSFMTAKSVEGTIGGPFRPFNNVEFSDVIGLKNHLDRAHKLKLCDLCLGHNKLFPFEYSYYDIPGLKKHMKEGEPNTSHRGHPNCKLPNCNGTFFNEDEVLQHMSREHFPCHLCELYDSDLRIYFYDYDSLRDHFKAKHFLCERDDCKHEQFTSAFGSEFDLQVHINQVHRHLNSNMSKNVSKLNRTITLNPVSHRDRNMSSSQLLLQNLPTNAAVVSIGTMATANNPRQPIPNFIQQQLRQQRVPARSEFPSLGATSTGSINMSAHRSTSVSANHYPGSVPSTSSQSSAMSRVIAGPSDMRGSFVRTVGGGHRPAEQLSEMDFPPLPEQPNVAKKSKAPKDNSRIDKTVRTLEDLISTNLSLSKTRNNKFNGRKAGSAKSKRLKIQLS